MLQLINRLDFMRKFGYLRAGTGVRKDQLCGVFLVLFGCLREDLHCMRRIDDLDYSGKVFIKRVYHSCDRPECPTCFKRWALKEAGNAESRLKACANRFGVIEHIIDSCPKSEYDLPYDLLKARSLKAMRACGFLGGFQIFHAQRYHHENETYLGEPAHWFYAPHFHYVGFIDGGYGACRSCHKDWAECYACSGFEGLTRRLNVKDGHIVKVLGVCRSIFATLYYQLNHSTVICRETRSHVGSWVGVCAYVCLH